MTAGRSSIKSAEQQKGRPRRGALFCRFQVLTIFFAPHFGHVSFTTHGSAVIGGSDGTTEGEGTANSGHTVTVDNKLATYVTDGKALKVQAIIKKADADVGCEFVGLYYTTQGEKGNSVTQFLQLAGNVIEDTGSLTDEQKKGKWIKSTNDAGDTIYTYYLENITSATDLRITAMIAAKP